MKAEKEKATIKKCKNTIRDLKKEVLKKKTVKKTESKWLSLDNAATIYPSIRNENWDFVFRVSAVMKHKIDKERLQQALSDIEPRFPSFFVKLKSGLFWNFFEVHDRPLKIEEEQNFPCVKFNKGSNEHLIRVLYYSNRISVECFHALADGRSALKFLNSLIKRYLELGNINFQNDDDIINYLDKPRAEELTDSFFEHMDNSKKLKHKEKMAYRIVGTEEEYGVVNSTVAEMSVSKLKILAKSYECKLFEFLLSVLGYSILKRVPKSSKAKRPIKLSVPIDLRQFFESETLRNFSGYLNVEIPLKKEFTLMDIIKIVKSEMAKITKERMQSFINSNVAIQKNVFIKIVPLAIKNFVISQCFRVWGESYQTLAISNLGINKVPSEFSGEVERFEFNLGRPKYNAKSMGIISFEDKLVCTISSKIKENTTEKDFLRTLSSLGVTITVGSNRRDLYE